MAEEAKKTAKKAEEPVAPVVPVEQDPEEIVYIKLHMDKQHMEPLHVLVNDYVVDIPRGVDYPVPYYVAKHIEEMEKQDNNTLLLTRALSDRFDAKVKALGI